MGSKKHKRQDNDKHWTFAAIVLVGLGLFLLVSEDNLGERHLGSMPKGPGMETPIRVEDRIDLHLKSTNVRTQIGKFEAESAMPPLQKDQYQVEHLNRPLPLDRKQSVHAVEVSRDQADRDRLRHDLTPEEQIELDLARRQFLEQYDEKAKEAFIQEFLRNAREQGLEIELDENLEVISVKRNPAAIRGRPSASK